MKKLLLSLILLFVSDWTHGKSVLVLGDSISAAYGLEKLDYGWVAMLQEKLKSRGLAVVNASISGETSAGGLSRIDELLRRNAPSVVILELGANDGLRGLSLKVLESNLDQMINRAKAHGAEVLLLGMRIPPNYGRYAEQFQKVFPQLAERQQIPYVPFLMDGIGGHSEMMQADGLHPNRDAQVVIFGFVWEKLEPMLGNPNR
jgi:acyl-CoA thioesterase-1